MLIDAVSTFRIRLVTGVHYILGSKEEGEREEGRDGGRRMDRLFLQSSVWPLLRHCPTAAPLTVPLKGETQWPHLLCLTSKSQPDPGHLSLVPTPPPTHTHTLL